MSFDDAAKKAAEALGKFIDDTEGREKVLQFRRKGEKPIPPKSPENKLKEDSVNFYLVIAEAANTLPHLFNGDLHRSYQVVLNSLILVMGEMLINMSTEDGDTLLEDFVKSVKQARELM